MLSEAEPSLSAPLAMHSFRRVCYDQDRRSHTATDIGSGVTRVPLASIASLLEDIELPSDNSIPSVRQMLGYDQKQTQADETVAAMTVTQLQLGPGDMLDCAVTDNPSSSSRDYSGRHGGGTNKR